MSTDEDDSCKFICSKAALVFVNVIFCIGGVLLLAIGVFIKYAKNTIMDVVSLLPTNDHLVNDALNSSSLLTKAAIAFIVVGIFLFIFSIVGCCGTAREEWAVNFLVLYIIVVIILIIVQVVAVGLLVVIKLSAGNIAMKFMHNTIKDKYTGASIEGNNTLTTSDDALSRAWDYLMGHFECCGATNYTDFRKNATKWNSTIWYQGDVIKASVPVMCCKMEDHNLFPADVENVEFVDLKGCLESANLKTTNQKPCYEAVHSLIQQYLNIGLGIVCAVFFTELLGVVAAVVVYSAHDVTLKEVLAYWWSIINQDDDSDAGSSE